MSNLVCDFYDDDGVRNGPWHWTEVICRNCFESRHDWLVRVSEKGLSESACERCGARDEQDDERSAGPAGDYVPEQAEPAEVYLPSQALAVITGTEKLGFREIRRRVWAYITENQLQHPVNQRTILCDEVLEAALGVTKIDVFALEKQIRSQLS